jgi:hypothetical protein
MVMLPQLNLIELLLKDCYQRKRKEMLMPRFEGRKLKKSIWIMHDESL